MALHTELDVYKTGYDLLTKVTVIVTNMERSFKRLIGEDILAETKKLMLLVYRANIADDKVPHLSMLIERVKLVEMLFRLARDMEKITDRQYWTVIRLTESIAKQTTKWREWAAHRPPHGVRAAMTEHRFNLVVPLAHEATAMRNEDTGRQRAERSSAVSQLSDRPSDVDSTMVTRSPGTRAPTTATRTTTTRASRSARSPSADWIERQDGFSGAELVAAYRDCRRTKRNSASALAFETNLEPNLARLYDELSSGSYMPGRSKCFVITHPKPREVWAASFPDRVVQHMVYNRIGARFERTFIADSCACIKGRGTLYAAQRLEEKVRSITQNWSKRAFYLKCDLANFFVSIPKSILLELLLAKIDEPRWRWLTEIVLMHDPRRDFHYVGDPWLMALVPPHKRLLEQPSDLGLAIGNLISQLGANVLLNVFDQFVKHVLRVQHYVRYVDDFVFLDESPARLNEILGTVTAFLPAHLGVRINPRKTVLQPIDRGVDFVGQVIKPWRRETWKRTRNEALRRVAATPAAELMQVVNSYFGLLRQSSASHHDRAMLANVARSRGKAIDRDFTKTYRGSL